jgi:hypothetical protein
LVTNAINEASKLGKIGFPEFTAKLVTDTFDALIAANLRQTEAYIELVKAVSQDVKDYINNTKDDMSGEMVLQFLSTIFNDPSKKVVEGTILSTTDISAIKAAVDVDGFKSETSGITIPTTALSEANVKTIVNACCIRLTSDKYYMLKEMVRMGVLRLVVESGTIETKMFLHTADSQYYSDHSSYYNSTSYSTRASVGSGLFTSLWCRTAVASSLARFSVSTFNSSSSAYSSNDVQISGLVKINFKTDYQQLNSTT